MNDAIKKMLESKPETAFDMCGLYSEQVSVVLVDDFERVVRGFVKLYEQREVARAATDDEDTISAWKDEETERIDAELEKAMRGEA